ncbi:MAG: hypothetical protein IPO77_21355 [Acidobacteria bacterium]|nr:hypothetical protein [Acidobacteriota bacterium]
MDLLRDDAIEGVPRIGWLLSRGSGCRIGGVVHIFGVAIVSMLLADIARERMEVTSARVLRIGTAA